MDSVYAIDDSGSGGYRIGAFMISDVFKQSYANVYFEIDSSNNVNVQKERINSLYSNEDITMSKV